MDKNQERKYVVGGALAALGIIGISRYRKYKRMKRDLNHFQETLRQYFYDQEFRKIVEENF